MSKRFMKVISMTLVAVLLINVLPVIAIEEEGGEYNDKDTSTENAPVQEDIINQEITVLGELDKKRSEYTKQYLLSDGTRVANVYADPVHYEKDGQWEEIDNTLVAKINGTYANTAGIWDVSFPQQLNKSKQITITKDGYTLSFGMGGRLDRASGAVTASVMAIGGTAEPYAVSAAQTTQAQIQQVDLSEAIAKVEHQEFVQSKLYSRLSYANVYANTDIVYDLQSNKVKESVIVSQYDSTLRGYRYTLNTGELIPVLDETGHIEFYDASMENIVMTMPAPFLVDANNVYNFDIQVQLSGSGGTYTLTYLLPQQWLASTERAYPVVLDPIVQAGTGVNNIADQTVFSIGSKSYTWIVVECGYDVNMGKERFFMAFTDLPELSASDEITNATVALYKPYSSSTPFYVGVHSVANTWASSSITWSNMPNTGLVSEDYNMVTDVGWYGWDVTNLAKDWYANGVNTGMMFKASDTVEEAAVNHWSQFYSSDNGSYSPTLTIEYRTVNSISVGDSADIDISISGEKEYFSFTPATTGFYTLESFENDGDPYVWLYNSNQELLATDDDADDSNFRLTYHLLAGHEYNIAAGCYGDGIGTYSLYLYSPISLESLSTTSISLDAEKPVVNDIALESVYFKFVPQVSGEYLFYSTDASYDPKLYLYSSSNSLIDDDDDTAGNSNFRIAANLTAGQTYYLAASHYSTRTGTYTLNVLMAPNIPSDTYYLRNEGTDLFLDIHGPSAQEWVHQWSYSRGAQSRWAIVRQTDGYYTIQSKYGNQYYVGISSEETEEDNIKLFSSISDSTRWKIYAKSTGELFIEPKRATGMVLYSPNSSIGTELRLEWMSSSVANRNKWKIEMQSSTPLIGQWTPEWCWAAAAQMFAAHYVGVYGDSDEDGSIDIYGRDQADAVEAVKGSSNWSGTYNGIILTGGSIENAHQAINYLLTGSIYEYDIQFASSKNMVFDETTLRQFLNDGHVVYMIQYRFDQNNKMRNGHASVIVGYTTVFSDGAMEYLYIINDPAPDPLPDTWTQVNDDIIGHKKVVPYQWIAAHKKTDSVTGELLDNIWNQFVVAETEYSSNTIKPVDPNDF